MQTASFLAPEPTAGDQLVSSVVEMLRRADDRDLAGFEAAACLPWSKVAREKQQPPPGQDWTVWFLRAGRGFGKTWTGSGYLVNEVQQGRVLRPAVISPTAADLRDTVVEGDSGLLAMSESENFPCIYNPSKRRVTWPTAPNGPVHAILYSAEKPGRLRGPQHDFAWLDEAREYKKGSDVWSALLFNMRRRGTKLRIVITTSPLTASWLTPISSAAGTVLTTGSTYENLDNLNPEYEQLTLERYRGTRLAITEIDGQELEEIAGALFTHEMISASRVHDLPYLPALDAAGRQIMDPDTGDPLEDLAVTIGVVAIDPSGSESMSGNEVGIVAGYKGKDGCAYVTHDWSGRYRPEGWARRGLRLHDEIEGDEIVAERNFGGEIVRDMIRAYDASRSVNVILVNASRAKHVRATPVSMLMQQGRVKLVGYFPKLESQLNLFNAEGYQGTGSPDRGDALVWLVHRLLISSRRGPKVAGPVVP